jgi:hypothetical protein
MAKTRVSHLAKEFNLDVKELILRLREINIEVENYLSSIEALMWRPGMLRKVCLRSRERSALTSAPGHGQASPGDRERNCLTPCTRRKKRGNSG